MFHAKFILYKSIMWYVICTCTYMSKVVNFEASGRHQCFDLISQPDSQPQLPNLFNFPKHNSSILEFLLT